VIVGGKITPRGYNPEASQHTTYPSTGVLAQTESTIVDVNTSHSIEKYPEDKQSD
jgi:hypothetical protein